MIKDGFLILGTAPFFPFSLLPRHENKCQVERSLAIEGAARVVLVPVPSRNAEGKDALMAAECLFSSRTCCGRADLDELCPWSRCRAVTVPSLPLLGGCRLLPSGQDLVGTYRPAVFLNLLEGEKG